MSPYEIKVRLLRRNISQRSIALKLGVSGNAVSLVVRKKRVSNKIAAEISKAIGVPKEQVFPEYYRKPIRVPERW